MTIAPWLFWFMFGGDVAWLFATTIVIVAVIQQRTSRRRMPLGG